MQQIRKKQQICLFYWKEILMEFVKNRIVCKITMSIIKSS